MPRLRVTAATLARAVLDLERPLTDLVEAHRDPALATTWMALLAMAASAARLRPGRPPSDTSLIEGWLSEQLADGPQPVTALLATAQGAGYRPATLRTAAARIGVVLVHAQAAHGRRGGQRCWRLPAYQGERQVLIRSRAQRRIEAEQQAAQLSDALARVDALVAAGDRETARALLATVTQETV